MNETVEIKGVGLIKTPEHLGNRIQVLVELADGNEKVVIDEVADDGPISHYVHAITIRE